MRACIIPGSFDPFTLGHLDIVARASRLFDKVYVAIMVNPEKQGRFDFRQRKLIVEATCAGIPNISVITADGLLADLCTALGVCAIVKGVRNATDLDYETSMASANRFLAPGVETVFLPAKAELAFVSSTFVRELIKHDRPLGGVMHPDAVKLISSGFKSEN